MILLRTLATLSKASVKKSKPLLTDILPRKKVISKLLFDFNAKYNYHHYLPVVMDIYDKMESDKEPVTDKLKGSDLIIFQRVLKEIRTQTHSSNKYLKELEDSLIEEAATLGNRDALTIICFKSLDDTTGEYTKDDKEQAKIFINKLSKLKHPLVFKMAGDHYYRKSDIKKAVNLYGKFLKLDNNSFLASEVYKTLGMLSFQEQKLMQAKVFMEKAINLAPSNKVSQAHFILGLINEIDPLKARYHFEMAASEGFLESFVNLGFLELNYFRNIYKSKLWFKLGAELGDYNCMIGLFDCYMKEENWKNAKITYDKAVHYLRDIKSGINLDDIRSSSVEKLNRILGELEHSASNISSREKQDSETPIVEKEIAGAMAKSKWDI